MAAVSGGVVGAVGSVLAGAALAGASVVGLISSQTAAPAKSPANTSEKAVFDYGTTTG